jgi:hypothetical protein
MGATSSAQLSSEPRPLGDPLRALRKFLGGLILAGGLVSGCLVVAYCFVKEQTLLGLPSMFVAVVVPTLIFVWRILPGRTTNAFYLRSFKNDPQTWRIRTAAQAALGNGFRLSGIRDPGRRRSVLDYVALVVFALRYSTPKFMNLEAGADWKVRLWRSLGQARCALIEISALTPFVTEEIELSYHCLGLHRILFIGDQINAPEAWRSRVATLLPTGFGEPDSIQVAVWNGKTSDGRRQFSCAVKSFAVNLPEGLPGPSQAAVHLVRAGSPPATDGYAHNWKFFVYSQLLSVVLSGIVAAISASLIPSLNSLFNLVVFAIIGWVLIGYLIDCGSNRERIWCTLSLLLPAVSICSILPAVERVHEAQRRLPESIALHQLAIALHNYHAVHDSFPAGSSVIPGQPPDKGHSWLVYLLPYMERAAPFYALKLTEPWDSQANTEVFSVEVYYPFFDGVHRDTNQTPYVGVAGLGREAPSLPAHDRRVGVFGYGRKTRLVDITDGLENTIMVTGTTADLGPWMCGGFATVRGLDPDRQPYIGRNRQFGREGGTMILYADGSVRWLKETVDARVFEALATIHGGEEIPDDYGATLLKSQNPGQPDPGLMRSLLPKH